MQKKKVLLYDPPYRSNSIIGSIISIVIFSGDCFLLHSNVIIYLRQIPIVSGKMSSLKAKEITISICKGGVEIGRYEVGKGGVGR